MASFEKSPRDHARQLLEKYAGLSFVGHLNVSNIASVLKCLEMCRECHEYCNFVHAMCLVACLQHLTYRYMLASRPVLPLQWHILMLQGHDIARMSPQDVQDGLAYINEHFFIIRYNTGPSLLKSN